MKKDQYRKVREGDERDSEGIFSLLIQKRLKK
jgi:hypothetical protein